LVPATFAAKLQAAVIKKSVMPCFIAPPGS
jgi:hypothetical protein